MTDIISKTSDYVKSTLDLNILITAPSNEPLLISGGYVKNRDDHERLNYYRPIIFEGERIAGYVSSTLVDILEKNVKITKREIDICLTVITSEGVKEEHKLHG